jgi:hypothetical protein
MRRPQKGTDIVPQAQAHKELTSTKKNATRKTSPERRTKIVQSCKPHEYGLYYLQFF